MRSREDPFRTALRYGQGSLSWSEVNSRANQLAHLLVASGVQREDCIAIAMERSPEMVICIFAIFKAGAAYVPVDPFYPEKRIRFILEETGARILLTRPEWKFLFENLGPEIVPVNLNDWQFGDQDPGNPGISVKPDSLAYILYTSGSTGKPKGVMMEHHAVVNLISYIQRRYTLDSHDTVLFKSPYTFDGSVWELFGWLIPGCMLYIAQPGAEKDPDQLLQILSEERISFIFFVSSMLNIFLEHCEGITPLPDISSLKWVSVGGEVVSPALVQRFYNLVNEKRIKLINVYGPTETCVYASTYLCRSDEPHFRTPVGRAVDNNRIFIRTGSGKMAAEGEEGEILIAGAGVARGYLKQDSADTEKFFTDDEYPGTRFYRTGDFGALLKDGLLDFSGRKDTQVKLRGLRIETGEIENNLLKIPLVKEAAVIMIHDRQGDDVLAAFIVTGESKSMTEDFRFLSKQEEKEVAGRLSEMIPSFMIPTHFVLAKRFPLNKNGKTDRKLLYLPERGFYPEETKKTYPVTKLEMVVAAIWAEILGETEPGLEDNFFDLGGHSLKAARIVSGILTQTGYKVPISMLFEHPVLRDFCMMVAKSCETEENPSAQRIPRIRRTNQGYPLTATMNEMWFLHSMDRTGTHHNIVFRIEITGEVDAEHFRKAMEAIVERNEILRTTISLSGGAPRQFIREPFQVIIPFTDILGKKNEEQQIILERTGEEIGLHTFQLDRLPLFLFHWVKVSQRRHVIFWCIHHIIFDGWSMYVFFNAWKDAYKQAGQKIKPILPALKIQNVDYAVYQNERKDDEILKNQLDYWRTTFSEIPENLTFPFIKQTKKECLALQGQRIWWMIGQEDTRRLNEIAVSQNSTLFSVLLSGFSILLSHFSGRKDIVVGTPYANRSLPETEDLIGYFTHMVALKTVTDPEISFLTFLTNVQKNILKSFSNAEVPFGSIVRSLGLTSSPGVYPLFQVIFVLQNWDFPDMEFGGLRLTQKETGNGAVKAEIMFNAEEVGNEIECWFEYDTALFTESAIRMMIAGFLGLLKAVAADPTCTLKNLDDNISAAVQSMSPTVLLLGETSLLRLCGEMLLENGLRISGVVSSDRNCINWAGTKNTGITGDYEDIGKVINGCGPIDYLFSIVNSCILKKEHLAAARIACINYHDSLLPGYAGINATSWSLINGEPEHGITWHRMTEEIDQGLILKSLRFRIEPDETALSLNARCFESALRSFGELLPSLLNRQLPHTGVAGLPVQYFKKKDKPFASAFLVLSDQAVTLCNLIRGLHLGESYPNLLAAPKLTVPGGHFIIESAKEEPAFSREPPGTLIRQTDNSVVLSTGRGNLKITGVTDLFGNPLPAGMLAKGVKEGEQLSLPGKSFLDNLDKIAQKCAPFEPFWVRALGYIHPSDDLALSGNPPGIIKTMTIPLPVNDPVNQIAGIFLFLACYYNRTRMVVGIGNSPTIDMRDNSDGIFAGILPFPFPYFEGRTAEEILHKIRESIRLYFSRASYPTDLIARIPELKRKFKGRNSVNYRYIILDGIRNMVIPDHINTGCMYFITGKENCHVVYCAEDKESEEIIARLSAFLENLKRSSHLPLAEISLLTEDETEIHGRINPSFTVVEPADVLTHFADRVEKDPGKPAVVTVSMGLTYKELDQYSGSIAGRLLSMPGFCNRKGQIIAVCLERTPDLIAALFGILKAGAAYLPIDPVLPHSRIRSITDQADPFCILTITENAHLFKAGSRLLFITDINQQHLQAGFVTPASSHPAYIIYTSGTTGSPKGVVISRRALSVFVEGSINRYTLTPADRILQFASISFDASVEEIFPALCAGATLVLRTEESMESFARFVQFCHDHAVTVLDLPTAFWNRLIRFIAENNVESGVIRLVIIGGDKADSLAIEAWKGTRWSQVQLMNTYGPTEATVVVSSFEISPVSPPGEIPIGKPVYGAKFRVVNAFGQPGIPAIQNRLLIGGHILAEGYLHDHDLTLNSFREYSFSHMKGRFYDSGDLVTVLPNGNLLFRGRTDHQVKIRGYRVDTIEVSSMILSLSGISDAVVVPFLQGKEEIVLAAYIVTLYKEEGPAHLRERLGKVLPHYMMPAIIIQVPFLPYTAVNKVDVNALPDPVPPRKDIPGQEEILNGTEKLVMQLWRDHLRVGEIHPDDDFFALGGDSLMAVEIMSGLESQIGRPVPLASLFTYPTVRLLAKAIDSRKEKEEWKSVICIHNGKGRIPLFIIHGAGLNILLFNTLAKHLSPDQPVYGVQPAGMDGATKPHETIEEIKEHYLREIKTVQPEGPYAIAGFSMGGIIAYELCRTLSENGEKVSFLGLFDTPSFNTYRNRSASTRIVARWVNTLARVSFTLRLIIKDPGGTLPGKWKWWKYRVRLFFNTREIVPLDEIANLPHPLVHIARANLKAVNGMTLQHYPGTLHLFRAQNRNFYVKDPEYLGWNELANEVVIHSIPGEHSFIFAPPNDILFAEELQKCLDNMV